MTEQPIEAHIYMGPSYSRHEPSPKYCAAAVHGGGRSVGMHQCCFKPKIRRLVKTNGKVKAYGFCSLHDPVAVQKKRIERKAKWDHEWAAKTALWKRQDQMEVARNACVDAIKKISAGHNDPMTLAREVLAMFPDDHEEVQ